jgi:hypothetical protein
MPCPSSVPTLGICCEADPVSRMIIVAAPFEYTRCTVGWNNYIIRGATWTQMRTVADAASYPDTDGGTTFVQMDITGAVTSTSLGGNVMAATEGMFYPNGTWPVGQTNSGFRRIMRCEFKTFGEQYCIRGAATPGGLVGQCVYTPRGGGVEWTEMLNGDDIIPLIGYDDARLWDSTRGFSAPSQGYYGKQYWGYGLFSTRFYWNSRPGCCNP